MSKSLPPSLSLAEARRFGVCRLCRSPQGDLRVAGKLVSRFIYNGGVEHAHEHCLALAYFADRDPPPSQSQREA